ncbi:MAG: MATE family efflux transporter [Clostridia bacterium]
MNNNSHLGTQSIPKLMFNLALPAVVSQVVNMLYSIIDRMYIGHIADVGIDSLTGIGLCAPIIMIVSAFSYLFGTGGAPKAAIEMGKGNTKQAEKILGNCTFALILSSIFLMLVLVVFGKDLLYLFGASDVTITYAYDYLKIYSFGTIFVQLTLGLNTFITTQGFAKYSMFTIMIGAITNIILDPIFIYVLNMGVQGAALATTISQCLSAIWVFKFLTGKKTILKIKKENLVLKKSIILPVVALGLSPFIMSATESLLNICFNVSLQKYGGDIAVGAMTILSSIMMLCLMPLTGISQGCQPIISFNYGAKNMDRVKSAFKIQLLICVFYSCTFWLVIMLIPEMIISIFNSDAELLSMTTWALRIYGFGLFALGVQLACQQTFVALGQAKISLLLACLRKIILLIPLIFLLPVFFENNTFAVFLSEPIADILAATITGITFMVTSKKLFNNTL